MVTQADCFKNRDALSIASLCACFNCLKAFPSDLIANWTVGPKQLRLNAGALLKDRPQSASADENLCGFFTFDWHDHDNLNRQSVHVEESPFPGQIELLFHGTDCLRIWFERIARRLDR